MADAADEALSKVDSLNEAAKDVPKKGRRASSMAPDVYNIDDLEKEGKDIKIAVETQHLGWKINKSSSTVEEKEVLSKPLTDPKLKKIDLQFPMGLEVTARNLKGVTIKDALDAIYKSHKKRADDELEKPYLAGFEWDKEECYTKFIVHLGTQPTSSFGGNKESSKKKKKKTEDE